MSTPELLILSSTVEYRDYYENNYCRADIYTADGIRVYFSQTKFGHAFYKNSQGTSGPKDQICNIRCQRMSWIKPTLENPNADVFFGWNKESKCIEDSRRVSVVYESFVVIIELSLNLKGELKANFVTCYQADQSIVLIRKSPKWDKLKCMDILTKKNCR